jgi:hypothetical protein
VTEFGQLPSDSFMKQSCREEPLSDKSQDGCHCRGLICQLLKGMALRIRVFFARII